jgi:hypothetical protein
MIVRLETLEKKLKGLQHILSVTDEDVAKAHNEAVEEAAAAEDDATSEAELDAKAAKAAVLARAAAKAKK